MLPILQRRDTVIDEARGTAPHRHVAAFQPQTAHRVSAPFAAPQEYRRQPQRDGNDRRPGVVLIAILMQSELRPGGVAVDQAGVGVVIGKSGSSGS